MDVHKLYRLLAAIPRGKVVTYGQLAALLGSPRLARAVGNALHANPDGDKYPCYRVVNAAGRLSERYAFGGLAAQQRRLEQDGISVTDGKVDLRLYRWIPENTEDRPVHPPFSCGQTKKIQYNNPAGSVTPNLIGSEKL